MGLSRNSSSGPCWSCGKSDGTHMGNCEAHQPGAKRRREGEAKYEQAKQAAEAAAKAKAKKYVDQNKNNRFRTKLVAGGSHGGTKLPPGVKMVEDKAFRGEKVYKIVLDDE